MLEGCAPSELYLYGFGGLVDQLSFNVSDFPSIFSNRPNLFPRSIFLKKGGFDLNFEISPFFFYFFKGIEVSSFLEKISTTLNLNATLSFFTP